MTEERNEHGVNAVVNVPAGPLSFKEFSGFHNWSGGKAEHCVWLDAKEVGPVKIAVHICPGQSRANVVKGEVSIV